MRRKCNSQHWMLASLIAIAATTQLQAAPATSAIERVEIVAEKMCCQGCARKVSGQLYAARGVREVGVDMSTHTLTVTLPRPNAIALGQLWSAVEESDGGPTKLVTAEATYTLARRDESSVDGQRPLTETAPLSIAIDNLHCKGCATKIAAKLYALKGVMKVSVDMQQETLFVAFSPDTVISPWLLIAAVQNAGERPLSVSGPHGTLAIEWVTELTPKNHQQARQTTHGGIQR